MSFTIFQNEKTPFQAIKTRSSKSRKIDICSKRLTHGFGLKMVLFPCFIFYVILARKMSFTIFQNEKKKPFQVIKIRTLKSQKIDIFPKGLTHGFGRKTAVFKSSIFQAKQARKMSFTIFYIEKTPLQPIKTKSSKSRKTDIFPKGLTHSIDPKLAIFPNFFLQVILARKMSFTIFQNEKTPFQTINTTSSESQKIDIFPNGLTHGFGQKMAVFPTFPFQAIQARKMSFTIFYIEKTPFAPIKQKVLKVEKLTFFQRG